MSQARKMQMNTEVNKERPGSAFKMPSRIKSLLRIKHSIAQGSTKPLQRTTESMDSDTDHHVVTSINLKEMINNYNTGSYLTVWNLIGPLIFLNVNLLHIIYFYLNECKRMTDFKLLLLLRNHLTVCKQMKKSKWNDSYWIEMLEII